MGWLNQVRARARTGVTAPPRSATCASLLDEMRLFKDDARAGTSCAAPRQSPPARIVRAMRATRPGRMEYEIEAELLYEFRRHGAQFPAYSPIVAGGANACVLHYRENDALLEDGDLLLIDAGCELDGYASDITRTFPVNGTLQRPASATIYELVLAAQAAAIAAVKPGSRVERAARRGGEGAGAGLHRSRALPGQRSTRCSRQEDYKRFYMHRTGHWLGLDVHDAGDYKRDGEWQPLAAGHDAHGRAGLLHPARPRACPSASGTSACASRTTCSSPRPAARSSPPTRRSWSTKSKR